MTREEDTAIITHLAELRERIIECTKDPLDTPKAPWLHLSDVLPLLKYKSIHKDLVERDKYNCQPIRHAHITD